MVAGIHHKRLVFVMAAGVQQQKARQAGVCSKALTVRHRGQYSGGRNPPEKASFRHGSRCATAEGKAGRGLLESPNRQAQRPVQWWQESTIKG